MFGRVIVCNKCKNKIPTDFINLKSEKEYKGTEVIEIRYFTCPNCKERYVCSVIDTSVNIMHNEKVTLFEEYVKLLGNKEEESKLRLEEIAEQYKQKTLELEQHHNELKERYKVEVNGL